MSVYLHNDPPYSNLLNRVRGEELARVCSDLVRLGTVNPPGNEGDAAQYVAEYLRRAGFMVSIVPHGESRASVVGRLKGTGDAPALLYNGHLDVVPAGAQPWSHLPFGGDIDGGRVWGRGSSDMKGGLTAMMVAARILAEAHLPLRGDLILTGTAGEEVDMMGARRLSAQVGLGPLQAIVISEPTANEIGVAERGVFWLEITTQGKTAHGSTPHLGQNAIIMMLPLLQELDRLDVPYTRHPVLGNLTRSINTIHGGVKTNVVPDSCVATVDFRTVPGQSHPAIKRQVEDMIAGLQERMPSLKASVKVNLDLPAVETDPALPVVRRFAEIVEKVTGSWVKPGAVPFATEAAIYVPALGTPTIVFGPGEPALAHQPDEYVEIDKMIEATKVFILAAASLLSG